MRYKSLFLLLVVVGSVLVIIKGKDFFFPSKKKCDLFSFPITEEKPFVIIIPSYNNAKYIEKNLQSVFSQNYENFRVIYIDDNSRDTTLDKAQQLLKILDTKRKSSLIHNPVNYGALANIYNAVHSCFDKEIIVLLDGDDFLAHENVLQVLNQTYADPNIWVTYGNYLDYPSFLPNSQVYKKVLKKASKTQNFRSEGITIHLRTFYASLFKEIPIADFFYRGRFYPMSWDLAIMFPLLEMSASHSAYIEDILYLHNQENPISDYKIHANFQKICAEYIREKPHYAPLPYLPYHEYKKQTADVVIFSENHPMQLYSLLESIQNYAFGIRKTTVLYQAFSSEIERYYLDLKIAYPTMQFIKVENNLKSLIQSMTSPLSENQHLILAQDNLILTDILDLSEAIQALEASKAFGFFPIYHQKLEFSFQLARHQPIPLSFPLKGIASGEIPFAWQFSAGEDDWASPNGFSFTLYRKKDLKKIFEAISFDSLDTLYTEWSFHTPQEGIGLYYKTPKCVLLGISSPKTQKDLLEKFDEGFKIDLSYLSHIVSPSQEITIPLTFVPRE